MYCSMLLVCLDSWGLLTFSWALDVSTIIIYVRCECGVVATTALNAAESVSAAI